KRKEIILDQAEEKKLVSIKDKRKRRIYKQETFSKEKENSSKNNEIVKERKLYPRIEETIIVWDILYHITRSQVFFVIKYLGQVKNIEMIRERSEKTRAKVSFEEENSFVQKIEV